MVKFYVRYNGQDYGVLDIFNDCFICFNRETKEIRIIYSESCTYTGDVPVNTGKCKVVD